MSDKDALCFTCLYRDARPEIGVGFELIYCMKKEMVVRPKRSCELYSKATAKSKEELRNSIYGTFNAEEEEG